MTDIAITWDPPNLRGDWTALLGGLATDEGLRSAVLVSLFTWRRASPDYVPPAGSGAERHGHWSDTYTGRQIGSRLWQLRRAKKTDDTTLLNLAQTYCQEALQWLLDDGVATQVFVRATWHGQSIGATVIDLYVNISRPGSDQIGFAFAWAWGP